MAGPSRFSPGVNAWDYGAFGGSGFGAADVFGAVRHGASPFQLRQLYHRAGELGLKRSGPAIQQLRAGTFDRIDPATGNRVAPGFLPQQKDVGFDFRAAGGAGFGLADVKAITGGNLYGTDHLDRVQELRNWAWDQNIGVGSGVENYLKQGHAQRTREMDINATQAQLKSDMAAMLAKANEAVTVHEPPKPTMRGAGGHFVPGTTRFQGQQSPTRRARGTLKSRFRRTGQGFQSALSIAGANQGATQSKVLNV